MLTFLLQESKARNTVRLGRHACSILQKVIKEHQSYNSAKEQRTCKYNIASKDDFIFVKVDAARVNICLGNPEVDQMDDRTGWIAEVA